MQKKHLVYIVSHVQKSLAFEWIATRLHHEYHLTFLLLNPGPSPLESFLHGSGIEVRRMTYRGKVDFFHTFLKTLLFLLWQRPDVIHAHLLDAQLVGLSAAWLAGIRKRVYTRHTSTYHHRYAPAGVKYDKLSNRLATQIVSISQATDHVLLRMENVSATKIVRIPHGFDFTVFEDVSEERIGKVKLKWNIPDSRPVIGVVSRHIAWKGIQFIIPAFSDFQKQFPNALLVLANASGPHHDALMKQLEALKKACVVQIPFEDDIAALYRVFDIFVHVPVDATVEAFGQTYVEAMASGIPSILTRSGIASEFAEDRINAMVVPFQDSDAITTALLALWKDNALRQRLASAGKRDVVSRFGLNVMLTSLTHLYNA